MPTLPAYTAALPLRFEACAMYAQHVPICNVMSGPSTVVHSVVTRFKVATRFRLRLTLTLQQATSISFNETIGQRLTYKQYLL